MIAKTQFLLTGFTQEKGFRIFEFEIQADDKTRRRYTVRADLNLLRSHSIQVQELPLLCRRLLERTAEGSGRSFEFTEESMREHALAAKLEREENQRRRSFRKAPVSQPGTGWRLGQR